MHILHLLTLLQITNEKDRERQKVRLLLIKCLASYALQLPMLPFSQSVVLLYFILFHIRGLRLAMVLQKNIKNLCDSECSFRPVQTFLQICVP